MRTAIRIFAGILLLAACASAPGAETHRGRHSPQPSDVLREPLLVPFWQDALDPEDFPEFGDSRRLSAPLVSGNNDFLHHLVLIPALEGFRVLEKGRFGLDVGFEGRRETRCGEREGNRWDASFFEETTRISYGLTRVFELRAGFNVAWFRPDNPDSVSLTQEGVAVLPAGYLEEPRPGVGNVVLGVKILSAFSPEEHLGLSTLLALKIPVDRSEFLSSGRGDFSLTFAGTGRLGLGDGLYVYGHANAGICWFDEESFFPEKVYLNPVGVFGAALVLPLPGDRNFLGLPLAFSAWAQGHGNAFRKMDVLNANPITAHAGARVLFGSWAIEASAGVGLSETGSPDVVVNLSAGSDF